MTTLKKGDKAPNFSAMDQDGKMHNSVDYRGKKLVVFFYPKASTPGCTAEACNLRDNWGRFQKEGYEIWVSVPIHQKDNRIFRPSKNFPFHFWPTKIKK